MSTTAQSLHQIDDQSLQQRFGLSYHIPYLKIADQKVSFANLSVLEVGGSLPQELVTDILGARKWVGIEETGYWDNVPDNGFGSKHGTPPRDDAMRALENCPGIDSLRARDVLEGRIEDLPATLERQFDRIFSIACFEHIHDMAKSLEAMHRALKPGGVLFTMFSPIWSAYDGHHLPQMTDSSGHAIHTASAPVQIANWAHLLLSPDEMDKHLDHSRYDAETRRKIIHNLYENPHINRYMTEDYMRFFTESPFKIVELTTTFFHVPPADIQSALEAKYPGYSNFHNNGILAVLAK